MSTQLKLRSYLNAGMGAGLEWDEDKSRGNREKRGFGFEIVDEFDWVSAHIEEDLRKDYGERRFRAFGWAGDLKIAVAFTPRGRDIRIISVRRMHDKEARKYGI